MEHYSVMLKETIDFLNIKSDGIYVDGTLGRGGHSFEILRKLTTGHLYCFDLDVAAIEKCKVKFENYLDRVTFIHSNFENIKFELEKLKINEVDGIVLDLGVSSPQFDEESRGFSYRFDSKLDMRMNQEQKMSAYEVVNNYSFNDLHRILKVYGEEKFAKQIARKIEKRRSEKNIETTFELVEVIKSALPSKVLSKKGHPAKQTFQAIRIEVNHELDSLRNLLDDLTSILKVDGSVAIITFHSLEDRIVKQKFKELTTVEDLDKRLPLRASEIESAEFILLNRKIVVASEEELNENSRSKSAKLRAIRRVKRNGEDKDDC